MSDYIRAARIVKARKKQGRLVVQPCDGLPFLLRAGMTAWVVPPSLDVPRRVVLREASEGAECTVSLEEVRDYGGLLAYVGRFLLVARADIDGGLLPDEAPDLAGFAVEDAAYGELGVVAEVLANAFQATLRAEGPRGEVLVPFVDEFVEGIDEEAGVIHTRVPSGLVED